MRKTTVYGLLEQAHVLPAILRADLIGISNIQRFPEIADVLVNAGLMIRPDKLTAEGQAVFKCISLFRYMMDISPSLATGEVAIPKASYTTLRLGLSEYARKSIYPQLRNYLAYLLSEKHERFFPRLRVLDLLGGSGGFLTSILEDYEDSTGVLLDKDPLGIELDPSWERVKDRISVQKADITDDNFDCKSLGKFNLVLINEAFHLGRIGWWDRLLNIASRCLDDNFIMMIGENNMSAGLAWRLAEFSSNRGKPVSKEVLLSYVSLYLEGVDIKHEAFMAPVSCGESHYFIAVTGGNR